MNTHNNIQINCFNTLITNKAKFDTLFSISVSEPQSELYYVWIDPITWDYGLDGKQYSAMDARFYSWNKYLLSLGISAEQMEKLNDLSNTRLNMSFRAGFKKGERHAESMAIIHSAKN